jgi:hypothetical protein
VADKQGNIRTYSSLQLGHISSAKASLFIRDRVIALEAAFETITAYWLSLVTLHFALAAKKTTTPFLLSAKTSLGLIG